MLGLGETDAEVRQTLLDLRQVGCDVVTFGQYLQPQKRHLPVEEFVAPVTEPTLAEIKREAFDQGYLLGRMHSRRLAEGKRNAPAIPVVVRPYAPRARKFPESLERVDWAGVVKATR